MKAVTEWRKRTRARIVKAMGSCCALCDYDTCAAALVAHHLDPSSKDFTLGECTKSWERIVVELRKCVQLCNRCHVEVHEGIRDIPHDVRRFDEAYAELPRRKTIIPHGKRVGYTYHGCRCESCRAANAVYCKKRRSVAQLVSASL